MYWNFDSVCLFLRQNLPDLELTVITCLCLLMAGTKGA